MLQLLDLPNEVLLQVVDLLPNESLLKFVRTCREVHERVNDVALSLLYRHLCLGVTQDPDLVEEEVSICPWVRQEDISDGERYTVVHGDLEEFVQKLTADLTLRYRVSAATIEWNSDLNIDGIYYDIPDSILNFLKVCKTNLRQLCLQGSDEISSDDYVFFTEDILRYGHHENPFAIDELQMVPQLPELRKLTIHGVPNATLSVSFITSTMPNLESLVISTSARCDHAPRILPGRLLGGYDALKGTLQELKIVDHEYCTYTYSKTRRERDPPPLQLIQTFESFPKLRKLGLRSDWLVPIRRRDEHNLQDLLPPSLEELEVQVVNPYHGFFDFEVSDAAFSNVVQSLEVLMRHKSTSFKHLASVKLWSEVFEPSELRDVKFLNIQIDSAVDAFREAGVKLEVA